MRIDGSLPIENVFIPQELYFSVLPARKEYTCRWSDFSIEMKSVRLVDKYKAIDRKYVFIWEIEKINAEEFSERSSHKEVLRRFVFLRRTKGTKGLKWNFSLIAFYCEK